MPDDAGTKPPYHLVMEYLVTDADRNALIRDDVVGVVAEGRFALVISDRRGQREPFRVESAS